MDKATYHSISNRIQIEIEGISKLPLPSRATGTVTVAETTLSPVDYDIYNTLREIQMQLMRLERTYWSKRWV